MIKLTTFAALVAIALVATVAESAWSGETTAYESAASAEQTPAPASPVVPGGYAQTWPQPPRWHAPQRIFGRMPPQYPPGQQFQSFPPQPAMAPAARENPLNAVLKQTQEQLSAKSSELIEAHSMLEQLRGKLQDSLAAEARLSDKVTYSTREQHALRVRVTDLIKTLNTANATLEQQHQLINDLQAQNQTLMAERDRLRSEFASRDRQLTTLQSELQAAMQTLAQAKSRTSDAKTEPGRQESPLQGQQKSMESDLNGTRLRHQTMETGLQPRYGRD
jgi:septal ring factor EnvC (AmiA/AmiB activator)